MTRNTINGLRAERLVASALLAASLIGASAFVPAHASSSVQVPASYPAGMIIIKQSERQLYFTNGDGTAIRYPIAIGKTGKAWRGKTYVCLLYTSKELLRVLKPGGRIVASVPFLQPVHGYPNHYFNMTQEGLKSLFSTGKVIGCFVPPNGHPILTLQWFLRDYLSGLPQEVSAAFSRMTFGEAVALTLEGALTHPAAVHLNPETSAKISCLNSIIVEKPA